MKRTICCCALLGFLAGCAAATAESGKSVAVVPAEPEMEAGTENGGLGQLDFRRVVKDAKARVFPAVMFIKCLRESHESGKKISQEISGSGVIISPDGEALTNWHVVDKAIDVRCLLFNGQALDAEVLGSDKDTDLALLQLDLPEDSDPLPCADLGDSTALKEGDFVMAMGAPWGLSRSVSIGIVSCRKRYLPDHSEYSLWLQTDAAISPGNSGGPLVNTDGEVVGINTRGVMIGGDMGFAIPSNTIRFVADQLREHGKVDWSWTGLQLQPLKDFNRDIYFEADEGVVVAGTDPESPARRSGFQPNDRIVKVNGEPITVEREENLPAARKHIGVLPKHEAATLEVVRDGETMVLELTPREKGEVEGEELDCPRWDLTIKEINQFDNPDLYFYRNEGIFVYGVKSPGNASNAGLENQDIILKIDGESVKSLKDVEKIHEKALENIETKHRVIFSVLRNGFMRQIVLDFMRDYEKE